MTDQLPVVANFSSFPLSVDVQLDTNPVCVYLAGLAPGSRRTMRQSLEVIASAAVNESIDPITFPWQQLRNQHVVAIRSWLAERYSPATANKQLAALRGVLKACWRLGLMSGEDYQRAVDVPAVKGSTLPRGRALEAGELRALFEACGNDPGPVGRRDAALLAILYGCGLRRSEAVALDVEDYAPDSGELRVKAGKGNKARLVYVTNGGRQAVGLWLAVRGQEPGPFFCPITKGGCLQLHRLTTRPSTTLWLNGQSSPGRCTSARTICAEPLSVICLTRART